MTWVTDQIHEIDLLEIELRIGNKLWREYVAEQTEQDDGDPSETPPT